MPKTDLAALILRGSDFLWCLAMSDVDGVPPDRYTLLEGLRTLECKSHRLGEDDLYSAIVRAMEDDANRQAKKARFRNE
jgi:hypothetical protein